MKKIVLALVFVFATGIFANANSNFNEEVVSPFCFEYAEGRVAIDLLFNPWAANDYELQHEAFLFYYDDCMSNTLGDTLGEVVINP